MRDYRANNINMDDEKTLQLISLLQDYPSLWKKQSKDFMNRDVRKKSFNEIAEQHHSLSFSNKRLFVRYTDGSNKCNRHNFLSSDMLKTSQATDKLLLLLVAS